MKKRKIIKIIVGALIVIAVVLAIWLNSEHPEIKLNEDDMLLTEHFVVRKGKVPHSQGISFLRADYISARMELDIDVTVGNIEKIIFTRESDNKTVSVEVMPGETKVELEFGRILNSERWNLSVVCSEDAEAKISYDIYVKEKWSTAIRMYSGGKKHHL